MTIITLDDDGNLREDLLTKEDIIRIIRQGPVFNHHFTKGEQLVYEISKIIQAHNDSNIERTA